MTQGIFCISIDLELLWGRKASKNYKDFIPLVKKERQVIKDLLKLFNKYSIPATWAIVGKLYEKGNPLWSGKDIINWIKKDKNQEIASHSYSHPDFFEINKKEAEKEFKKNKSYSFVFPKNHIDYLNILNKHNFKAYRDKDKSEFELILPRIPATGKPKKVNGLIEIPSSMYFVSGRGIRKYIPYGLRLLKSKSGINHAISKGELFHLWLHPVDFCVNTNTLIKEFEEILKYAARKREEEKLEIKTMKKIAQNTKH